MITASGGPFRGRTRAELADVTVEQALAHPTWAMGGKITIDSATLMNKGLEVMEAHHLFGMPYDRIDVVVHPQSIVHGSWTSSTARRSRTSGHPTCASPIAYALHHPELGALPTRRAAPRGGRAADLRAASTSRRSRACAWRARPRWPAAPRRACSTPPTRSPCTRSWTAACRSCGIAAVIEETLERAGQPSRCAPSRRSTRPTARRAAPRPSCVEDRAPA